MLFAVATETNDDPVAGGLGFVILGSLVLAFNACARWRRWRFVNEGGPWSARSAIWQGAAAVLVGLGMLIYSVVSQ
ncbi:hypothetical protein ACWEQ7_22955 [Streptomyces sp. NPDC004069]